MQERADYVRRRDNKSQMPNLRSNHSRAKRRKSRA